MINQLKSLILTQTGKDTGIVFVGTSINIVVGGIFFIIAPRILGVENFGLFATVMATGLMATNFANFGIDTGILKFIKQGETEKNNKILKLAVKAYILIGSLVLVFGFIISGKIATFLGIPQLVSLLQIAFIGTVLTLLSNFFVASLQSIKKFKEAAIVTASANVARLLVLAIASYFTTVDLYFLTLLFFVVPIVSILLGPIFMPLDFLKSKEEQIHFKDFFGYNFWIASSLAISSIPVDNYLLIKVAGPVATGLYAAPMKILTTTYQFAGGFSRVLAPRFSSFDTNKKAQEFALKGLIPVLCVSVAILLLGFFAPFIKFFWGNEYIGSIAIFRILTVGMAFFFAGTIPMAIILYYFGNSKIAFYITVWHYIIYTFLLIILVTKYSAVGAAIAFSASEIVKFMTLVSYTIYKFKGSRRID